MPRPRGEGAAGVPDAVFRLGKDRVGAIHNRPYDHVIGLGNADAEFVDGHRLDVVAVGLDDGHRQAVDAHVEDRRAVDEAQPHPLAGTEQRGPVGAGRLAVDEIRIGGAADIEDVGRAHPHPAPFEAVGDRLCEALALGIREECAQRALAVIVIVALKFEVADDGVGTFVQPDSMTT